MKKEEENRAVKPDPKVEVPREIEKLAKSFEKMTVEVEKLANLGGTDKINNEIESRMYA